MSKKSSSKSNSADKTAQNTKASKTSKKTSAAAAKKQKARRQWIVRIVAIIVIGVILGVSVLFFEQQINGYLRLKGYIEEDYSGLSTQEATGGITTIDDKLNVHFVDVGQGDACIIELPDERRMLIDGGKDKEKQKLLDYIEQNIFPTQDEDGIDFEFAILTHSDEDHCGGMDDVMNKYSIGTFYRPNQLANYKNYTDPGQSLLKGDVSGNGKSTLAYMRAIEAGHKNSTKTVVTDARDNSQNRIVPVGVSTSDPSYYEINFYTPTKDNYKDVNDYSPIIILLYQNKRIVLSGDAEAEAEEEFVALAEQGSGRYDIFDTNYNVDLIKLGHHGSRSSSSVDYLNTLTTTSGVSNVIIIISCGAGNSYGHPHSEVMERLIEMGFSQENILRTDVNGNIAMSIRQDTDGQFKLFFGAQAVRTNYQKPVTYREIAIGLFILAATAIIVEPVMKKIKKKK